MDNSLTAGQERRTLAILLNHPAQLTHSGGQLDDIPFTDRRHQVIYDALRRTAKTNSDVEIADVLEDLTRSAREGAAGGRDYVLGLLSEPGALQYKPLGQLVQKLSMAYANRATAAALEQASRDVSAGDLLAADASRDVARRLDAIQQATITDKPALFENMRELMTANLPERPALVAGLINTASVVLLAAPPKSGKSRLARQLALAVASGGEFLGHQVLRSGPVFVIAYEGHKRSIRDQIHTQSASMGVSEAHLERFHLSTRPESRAQKITIGKGAAWEEMLRTLKTEKAPLVIIDTVSKARPDGIKEDSADDVSEHIMEPILQAVRETGTTFMLLHHYRKAQSGTSSGDPADRIRGSGVFRAEAETNITMGEIGEPDEGRFRLHFEQRDMAELSIEILSNQDALTFEPVGAKAPTNGAQKLSIDQVVNLAAMTSPLDIDMTAGHFGVSESVAKATLLKAAEEKRLRHTQTGRGNGTRHTFHALDAPTNLDPYNGVPPF